MTLKSQVTHGLKWQAIAIIGRQLLALVVFTTLARLLDPAAFGLVALVGVYTYFISMLADLGIGVALVQRKDLVREHLDTFFWFNAGLTAFLCLLTVVLAGPLAVMMGEPKLAPLLSWCSFGLVFNALAAVQSNLFVKAMDFRRPAIRTLIANLSGGVVGVIMALTGYGVWSLVGQSLASGFAGMIFICMASDYRPRFAFSFKHLRDLIGVGSSVFANAIIWFFSSRLDQLIIGRFAGVPTLGFYVIANKVPDMIKSVTQMPLTEVSVPAMASLQDNHPRMREVISRGMEMNALVMFAVFVGIAAIAHDLVPFLFGQKWASAANLCSLLSIYTLICALQVFFYPALLAAGVTGKYVLLNIAQACGVAIACLVGIQFGVTYLVLGLIINSLVLVVPGLLFLRSRIGMSPREYCKPCLVPAGAALFMTGLIWLAVPLLPSGTPLAIKLTIEILLGAAGYIGFIFLFNRATLLSLLESVRHAIGAKAKAAGTQ